MTFFFNPPKDQNSFKDIQPKNYYNRLKHMVEKFLQSNPLQTPEAMAVYKNQKSILDALFKIDPNLALPILSRLCRLDDLSKVLEPQLQAQNKEIRLPFYYLAGIKELRMQLQDSQPAVSADLCQIITTMLVKDILAPSLKVNEPKIALTDTLDEIHNKLTQQFNHSLSVSAHHENALHPFDDFDACYAKLKTLSALFTQLKDAVLHKDHANSVSKLKEIHSKVADPLIHQLNLEKKLKANIMQILWPYAEEGVKKNYYHDQNTLDQFLHPQGQITLIEHFAQMEHFRLYDKNYLQPLDQAAEEKNLPVYNQVFKDLKKILEDPSLQIPKMIEDEIYHRIEQSLKKLIHDAHLTRIPQSIAQHRTMNPNGESFASVESFLRIYHRERKQRFQEGLGDTDSRNTRRKRNAQSLIATEDDGYHSSNESSHLGKRSYARNRKATRALDMS